MSEVAPGTPGPLGAHLIGDGRAVFRLVARDAERVELLLYDAVDDDSPRAIVALDPRRNRSRNQWHVELSGVDEGQLYAYRVHGPHVPERGLAFDGEKVLLDPYGRSVVRPAGYDRAAARSPGPNHACAHKNAILAVDTYDWQGDVPLRRPLAETVVYEAHVRGFTRHPSSGVSPAIAGTYVGFIEKIPYLVDLGVSAVELLPVFAFDPQDAPLGHRNYWGYAPLAFFAPEPSYASSPHPTAAAREFRDLVKALHRAGIEVFLDVVYNHTAEGPLDGPTHCLRGFGAGTYYIIRDDGSYADFSGCGNTVNANEPIVRRMILDSLRYWVTEMHVDGFRFDLASILTRGSDGEPLDEPPLLADIEADPVLAGTKLIAEAWDAAGLYQVGSFGGAAWSDWNGKFRDDVRRFVRGDSDVISPLADRIFGSPELYGARDRAPTRSINFVTAHDGFTVNDLVSYDRRRNDANGEEGRDGESHNLSWNHGVEGPSDDPEIEALRNQQVKNFFCLTLLSLGVPMFPMGDELRRTQHGNNNPYVQDNAVSWLDWGALERHADLHRFVRTLVRLRRRPDLPWAEPGLTISELIARTRLRLHGVQLGEPDLASHSRSLAVSGTIRGGEFGFYLAMNGWWEPLRFALPPAPSREGWRRVLDTARPGMGDLLSRALAPLESDQRLDVAPRSIVGLVSGEL